MQKWRERINAIDVEILGQMAKRQRCAVAIGKYKKKHGIAIRQPARERELLARVAAIAKKHRLEAKGVRGVYKAILAMSRRAQAK